MSTPQTTKEETTPLSVESSIILENWKMLEGGTLRILVRINGMLFKRLYDFHYPPVWQDEEYSIGDTLAIKDEKKHNELESIFQAWCINEWQPFQQYLLTDKAQQSNTNL